MKTKVWTTKWGVPIEAYFRVGKNDWNTHQSILGEDEYYFAKMEGRIGIDIGAFIGSASLAMASRGMDVYTVEALPENVEMINKNLKLNSYQNKVTVLHRAISSDSNSMVKLYYGNPNTSGGNVHEFIGHVGHNPSAKGRHVEVQTLSLDALFSENNLDHCDILKIDCEGGEWPCFEAVSEKTLDKIHYITGELHTGSPNPNRKGLASFLSLFKGKFDNITSQFGFKPQPDSALQGFIFKNKSW